MSTEQPDLNLTAGTTPLEGLAAEAAKTVYLYLQPGLGPLGSVKAYNDTCEKYEEYVEVFGYGSPQQVAKTMCELYPDQTQRVDIRILDVAAGTGLVGLELHKAGFTQLDALDPSEGMLAVAAKKGIYSQMFTAYIDEKQLPIPQDSYDAIVIAGGMGENQIPCAALHEMTRLVKPGGYIVNATREEHLKMCSEYVDQLEPLMADLERKGLWRQVTRTSFPNIIRGKEGLLLVHQVF